MQKIGFDNDLYIKKQSEQIQKRIQAFGGKLYLEFGGKLFDDYHASRVLPGFRPDSKVLMLKNIAKDVEIVIVINADAIEKNKMRSDLGITYDADVLRLIDAFRSIGLYVGSVVISQFDGQPSAAVFKEKLEKLGIKTYLHYPIQGYPTDIKHIVSEEGFGKNEYIETTCPLVVVTAPGPGSGKMATCLSQLYHEHLRGVSAGYAKFETFPIWNLPLKHPVNLAYEAATADLNDVNMIDPYHLEAYGDIAVNYNRDVEVFPVLSAMFQRISGACPYKSPTDMGVNMAGYCITDDAAVENAARDEVIRRYYDALCENRLGRGDEETAHKIEIIMNHANITTDHRKVVSAALSKSAATGDAPAVAIALPDGRIVTGKTSNLLGASSAALLNAVKAAGNIDDSLHLIEPSVIEPIQKLKTDILGNHNPRLHSDEVLIALTMSAVQSRTAKLATEQLSALRGCEAHSTVLLSQVDKDVYRKLGIHLTCEPKYQTKKLYHKG
ncbi:MAG: DUF1846 domain-containing protein [Clostridia bacterium]|nr:DUF1846 domain-containing protein [Clostridia bacterium]